MSLPLLYSYRRCPYAMRARMALKYAGVAVKTVEVSLKDKPAHLLQVSPKGTVPVLVLPEGRVIDQSMEIMRWALQLQDTDGWLIADKEVTQELIAENDGIFKQALDKYKYAIRFPEQPAEIYRKQGELFLHKLEARLNISDFLLKDQPSLADIAISPFVRQFAAVDSLWFISSEYFKVQVWLKCLVESALFKQVMEKQTHH
ncbi:MAG: glutathione S-transferase [Methylotenera sp.]|nr:glutathione S-transferase [Methylotenera sp.]MDP1958935.1 glutathione S-transferase [Methylotenera sp.]MDP3206809.1 glutathione S-transferase [Methylotenera sp.]MDP3943549.1 glutathione S-transferase [Methylotenera sp.]